jgi:hypothetical protein
MVVGEMVKWFPKKLPSYALNLRLDLPLKQSECFAEVKM